MGAPQAVTGPGGATGAAYVFRRSGASWGFETRLVAPDAGNGDAFGSSVGLGTDTAAVGAPADDGSGAADRGSAHVFERSASTWTWVQQLSAPAGAAGDAFGSAIVIEGAAILVGAPGTDGPAGTDAGAAHPFVESAGTWSAQPALAFADMNAGDAFGAALALSADTAVVGAPNKENGSAEGAGSAYFVGRDGPTWADPVRLPVIHANENARFGWDLAIDGDTVAVGAPGAYVPGGPRTGIAYVFTRAGTAWGEDQRVAPPQGTADDQFGDHLDLDGDTLVVGTPGRDLGGAGDVGAAYVFRRTGGVWTEEQMLVAPDGVETDAFGSAVAVSGDTVVVGAWNHDSPTGIDAGSAYVYVRSGASWTLQQQLTASDGTATDAFGVSVAVLGDTILIGAHGDDLGGGSAYVFRRTGTTWAQTQKLMSDNTSWDGFFGYSVDLSGDSAIVGAPEDQSGGLFNGAAYVFREAGGTWMLQQKLLPSDPGPFLAFGRSVALEGDRAVVGTGADTVGVYTFSRSGTVWTEGARLTFAGARGNLGLAVAVSGDTIAAGAPSQSLPGGPLAGEAHVFREARTDLSVTLDDGLTQAIPGTTITYTLVASNVGPLAVEDARVSTTLPAALSGASWTCTGSLGAHCTASGTGSIDDLADFPVAGNVTYLLSATVASGATGLLTNAASIVPPRGVLDPNPANDLAQDVDVLTVRTDLAVALSSTPTAVGSGALVTWATDVTNLGPSDSTGSVLVHDLADDATVVSVDPPAPTCVAGPGNVTCAFGTTAANASRRLTVVQRVDPGYLGPLFVQSSVTASETDPVAANNQAQLEIQAIPPGDAEIAHGTNLVAPLAPGGARYRISQRPYASYETVVDATSGDIGTGAGPALRLETVSSTAVESQPVGAGPSRSLRWRNDSSTIVDDHYVRVVSQGCTTDCGAEDVFRLRVYETTLSGPRFNNVGGQGTVLVLQNQGAGPVGGRAHFWSAGGALLATAPFDLAPHGSLALATATVVGLAGQSGTLTVSHDGAYGALTGKTVALVPATGASFDTPLLYRGR